ncbi:bromodomain-containing protein 7 [Ixodes scapularis]|nr:bromodomain-containing protein 7 [Ixodes scapularis]
MGSKKHKKHHKSEKKEPKEDDRQEKSLKLVLKVGGSAGGVQTPVPSPVVAASSSPSAAMSPHVGGNHHGEASSSFRVEGGVVCHAHESSKHKKSKKKKKKKSSSKEHREKKHRHHHRHRHHRHHHHHKDPEKKEKRKCEHDCSLSEDRLAMPSTQTALEPPPAKRPRHELSPQEGPFSPFQAPTERPSRDPRTCTLKKVSEKSPLQMLLYHLLDNLQKRDPKEFFTWPVSDVLAPGYSNIIHSPMDFSTMRKKIDDGDYSCVSEFRDDLKLMCDNAMTYNRSDTVYYKSAKRMWHSGNKLMSKEQLLGLESSLSFFPELTSEDLGFDIRGVMSASPETKPATDTTDHPLPAEVPSIGSPEAAKKCKSGPEEGSLEDQASNEILIQAQKAAQAAAGKLTLKRPNSKFSFLRQMPDGSTTLAILNPDCGANGPKEMKVNLEMLVGKLAHGTGTLMDFKDDIKNIARPINYLNYGTYSTYAPHYDSTFANLSKEESDLVYSTYGDELGFQYAESLLSFAKDCDYVMDMVDNLLDILTSGEHSKTVRVLEAHRNGIVPEEKDLLHFAKHDEVDNAEAEAAEVTQNDSRPPDALCALNDLTADSTVGDSNHANHVSHQNFVEWHEPHVYHEHHDHHDRHDHSHNTVSESSPLDSADSDVNAVLQQKLQESTEMIQTLSRLQRERLSATPPAHLGHIQGASELELELAEKVAKTLSELASHAKPGSIVSVDAIRKAMGINYPPTGSSSCHHHHSCPHVTSPYGVSTHDLPDSSSSNDVSLRTNDSPPSNT